MLQQGILERLFRVGTIVPPQIAFEEFEKACLLIEDLLPNYFEWEALFAQENRADRREFRRVLDRCLTENVGGLGHRFDELKAYATLLAIQQQFEQAQNLFLAENVKLTGIQEKYLTAQLTLNESLTELDIKRFIVETGMVGQIKVTDLDPRKIGLILNHHKNFRNGSQDSYSVAMMINLNHEQKGVNARWISVVVNINPVTNAITYKINCEDPLNQDDEAALKSKIEAGIRFGEGTTYEAFPPSTPVSGELSRLSKKEDKSKLGAGYRVLHQLYQDIAPDDAVQASQTNQIASDFITVSDNPQAIRQFVYEVQLRSLQLSSEQIPLLNRRTQDSVDEEIGRIKDDVIQQVVLLVEPTEHAADVNPFVAGKVKDLKPSDTKLTFPDEKLESALTSVDFEQFLLQVHRRLAKFSAKKTLNEMVLTCYDSAVLGGLAAYSETKLPFPSKRLVLDLNEIKLADPAEHYRFMINLKTMLLTLSDTQLSELEFIDEREQFDDETIAELSKFIVKNKVAVGITLPKRFQKSVHQKNIDEAVSDTIRARNIAAFSQKTPVADTARQVNRPVRKRPRPSGKPNVAIEMSHEQAQEQQVQVVVDNEKVEANEDEDTDVGEANDLTRQQFIEAVRNGDFNNSKSYLVSSSDERLTQLWCNWVGALSQADADLRSSFQLSRAACEQLLLHHDRFQYGIDLKNLPAGFSIERITDRYPPKSCIRFDEKSKRYVEYNSLQVQTTQLPGPVPLTQSQFNKWLASARHLSTASAPVYIWFNQLKKEPYDRHAERVFKEFLPQLLLLERSELELLAQASTNQDGFLEANKFQFLLANAAKLKLLLTKDRGDRHLNQTLIELFGPRDAQRELAINFLFNYKEEKRAFADHLLGQLVHDEAPVKAKIEALIARVPDMNLNALLPVYIQLGETGIDKLVSLVDIDESLFKKLYTQVFAKTQNHMPLLDAEYADAMMAIQGFSQNERVWWDTLLRQHCEAQTDVNLVDLVQAFIKFKLALAALPTDDNTHLEFPPTCELQDVKSLPVALSRILFLLNRSKEQDRKAQWHAVGGLDLSSNGAIKAASVAEEKQWAFITPQMQINAQHDEAEQVRRQPAGRPFQGLTSYKSPEHVMVPPADLAPTVSLATIRENFFRYAAFQRKNGQLALEFYQYVEERLDTSGASDPVQKYLYSLIAKASTGTTNVAGIESLAEAKNSVDGLVTQIDRLSFIPSWVPISDEQKDSARQGLLDSVYQLGEIPSLPILGRLIKMISTVLTPTLAQPLAFIRNQARLAAANARLRGFVEEYGNSVYEGMKDYTEEDYQNPELFFQHLAVVERIIQRFPVDAIQKRLEATNLMQMISTFRLTVADIDAIADDYPITGDFIRDAELFRSEEYYDRKEIVALLSDLSVKGKDPQHRLGGADLRLILNRVRDRVRPPAVVEEDAAAVDEDAAAPVQPVAAAAEEKVIDIVRGLDLGRRRRLATYFPESYLKNYGKQGVPAELAAKIAQHFAETQRKQIEKILLHFSKNNDSRHYEEKIVNKLIAICKPLSELEKNNFIAKLADSNGLYTDLQELSEEENDFVKLLDNIIENESPNEFISFIAGERQLLRDGAAEPIANIFIPDDEQGWVVKGLAKKAVFYLTKALPGVKAIPDLRLSQIDFAPRLIKTILKTPNDQMSQVIPAKKIKRDEGRLYIRQIEAVTSLRDALAAGNPINYGKAIAETQQFMDNEFVEPRDSYNNYIVALNKINTTNKVDESQIEQLTTDGTALFKIYFYKKFPSQIPEDERARFTEIFTKMDTDFDFLNTHDDLVNMLFNRPEFWDATGEMGVLQHLADPDLLHDDAKLSQVFAAMQTDVEAIGSFQKQTENLITELTAKKTDLYGYPNLLITINEKINAVVTENPSSRKYFLELVDRYLQQYDPKRHGEMSVYLFEFVQTLENQFSQTVDKNQVLSLCLQFCSDTNEELVPENLLNLCQNLQGVSDSIKKVNPTEDTSFVLKIAVELINNEKGFTLVQFSGLCQTILQDLNDARCTAKFATVLKDVIYKRAPMPTIDEVLRWHQTATQLGAADRDHYAQVYMGSMADQYEEFSLVPCPPEPANGFKIEESKPKLRKFESTEPGLQTLIDSEHLQAQIAMAHGLLPEELLRQFNAIRTTPPIRYEALVAFTAELLHRSKGKAGNSMQINTTQYLAILSMLKTPGHVTSEIGTGEGKSRIMMISLACQAALGHTVDFVTADAQLATRDLVEFKTFFDMIGVKTSMIFANSDSNEYLIAEEGEIGCINFSDPSNLSLFRNKARSSGEGDKVLDPNPENRALLLDEADKTYFDVADTRFNFSEEGAENIRGMQWVYPLLMAYFAENNEETLTTPIHNKNTIRRQELFFEDIDLSREKFMQYAAGNCTPSQLLRLKSLSDAQIEQWQDSAVTASHLKFKENFVIEPRVLIRTPKGPIYSSESQLLFDNRVAKGAKFSFGVHQCLQARLEFARQHVETETNQELKEALLGCEFEFYVPDEKQIRYSTTSKNLLDDYQQGTLKAVTGTAGAIIERLEATALYGHRAAEPMKFINVPRHKDLQRHDKSIRLTINEDQQINVLIEQIKEARAKNQPILVIAEDDNESESLFKKLKEVFRHNIQHVHSQLSLKEEKERIEIAGEPQQITVSTSMIGRGTDIPLKIAGCDLYKMAIDPRLISVDKIKELPEGKDTIILHNDNFYYLDHSKQVFRPIAVTNENREKLIQLKESFVKAYQQATAQDIKLITDILGNRQMSSKTHGLNVMVTYLPRERDQEQIIGRSGRFGAQGETSLILDKERTERMIGKKLSSDYYSNVEGFIKGAQAVMDLENQAERLILFLKGDFLNQLAKQFSDTMLPQVSKNDRDQFTPLMVEFIRETDDAWNRVWPHIQKELANKPMDILFVEKQLATYQVEVKKSWNKLRSGVNRLDVVCTDGETKPSTLLNPLVPPLVLDDATKTLFSPDYAKATAARVKAPVYDQYDRGHDGRAVKYKSWTIPAIASLKGYANLFLPEKRKYPASESRPPFANFRAALAGTGQIFPNFRASSYKGKVLGAVGLGLVGAGLGAALTATGVLAPIGIPLLGLSAVVTSFAFIAAIGLAVGGLFGLGVGAVVDAKAKRAQEQAEGLNTGARALAALSVPPAVRSAAPLASGAAATVTPEPEAPHHGHGLFAPEANQQAPMSGLAAGTQPEALGGVEPGANEPEAPGSDDPTATSHSDDDDSSNLRPE